MKKNKNRDKATSRPATNSRSRISDWDGSSHTSHLTEREQRIRRAIRGEPEARESFNFLVRKIGCDQNTLIIHLTQEAWGPIAVDDMSSGEKISEELPPFVKTLRRIAGKVRMLNQLPDWRFANLPASSTLKDRDRIQASFMELPAVLKQYADNINVKSEMFKEFKVMWPRPSQRDLELSFAKALGEWIQEKTGHSYRDKLAAIQRITYKEAGRTILPASGETLRKRLYRESRKLGRPKPPKKPGH